MNNLRKVVEKTPSLDSYLFKLECGHEKIVNKTHYDLNEIACLKCAESDNGNITHYYSLKEGNMDIKEYKRKCHLCGEIDFMSNFEPCKSSKGQYYYSHKKCIENNDGYATQTDNKNFKKKTSNPKKIKETKPKIEKIKEIVEKHSYKCKTCNKGFNVGYRLYNEHNDKPIDICNNCFVSTKLINMAKFKILECKSDTLFNNYIYKHCREILWNWKHDSFAMKKYKQDEGKIDTIHHSNIRFIDIIYTSLKLCNIEEKENYSDIEIVEIESLVLVIHWFMVLGVPMSTTFHNLYHDEYGRNKESINIETLKEFYTDERISTMIDKFMTNNDNRKRYINSRIYEILED